MVTETLEFIECDTCRANPGLIACAGCSNNRTVIERLKGTAELTETRSLTGEEAVFRMRDEFLQLAKCYLDIYDYQGALDATTMVKELEKFEDKHIITGITWPAKAIIDKDNREYYLEGNELSRSYV